MPQEPQLLLSLLKSLQFPLQHAGLTPEQTVPHPKEPQWLGSLLVSTQVLLQQA